MLPARAGQSYAQEKPGTTLQQLLLELSQVAGKLNLPLYLLKINRQRNFYCRFCSRTDTDGYARTGNILQRQSVMSWHCTSKRKNWQQALHLVDHTLWLCFNLVLELEARTLDKQMCNKCTMPRCGMQAMHADPASSTVERHFQICACTVLMDITGSCYFTRACHRSELRS